jgi:glycosyltransferase involved in cell wall biosynthesis
MMRILHVPYSFPPDPPGGTEIYVVGLAQLQRTLGCDVAVAAPAGAAASYEHAGIPVRRFPVCPHLTLRQLHGEGDPVAAEGFGRIMDEFRPEIVHLHGMTSAISVRLAAEASRRRIPIVFNYHTPTVSCGRGTLLRWGSEICDGVLNTRICAACALTAKGLSRPVASLLTMLPPAASRALRNSDLSGGIWTALRMPELTALRIEAFHQMMLAADRVLALCDWTRQLLLGNGVPAAKITLCRQGIIWDANQLPIAPSPRQLPLRLAFLGRLDATKGAPIVVRALQLDRTLPIQLDLYGVSQGDSGTRHAAELRTLIGDDSRVRLLPPLAPGDVIPALARYDALVAPSQWLETGPLVVLEAFAARIPVIGSDLGGIAELIADGTDGLLVRPFSSPQAWAAAFRRISAQPDLVDSWRDQIRPPRHTRQAALEIMTVYEGLLQTRSECLRES